jgi:hypothetical protein
VAEHDIAPVIAEMMADPEVREGYLEAWVMNDLEKYRRDAETAANQPTVWGKHYAEDVAALVAMVEEERHATVVMHNLFYQGGDERDLWKGRYETECAGSWSRIERIKTLEIENRALLDRVGRVDELGELEAEVVRCAEAWHTDPTRETAWMLRCAVVALVAEREARDGR